MIFRNNYNTTNAFLWEKFCIILFYFLNAIILQFIIYIYYISVFIVLVYSLYSLTLCVTAFFLSPPTWYKLKTGVIRFSMTWRGALEKNIWQKIISDGTSKKGYFTNASSMGKSCVIFFIFETQSFLMF